MGSQGSDVLVTVTDWYTKPSRSRTIVRALIYGLLLLFVFGGALAPIVSLFR